MIEIDGAMLSGSGTMLRYAVSLASLLGDDLHMVNIRDRRKNPGLRPQHLKALLACCQMTGGRVEGAEIDSQEIFYHPGSSEIRGQNFSWDIGTAGSTTMLAFSILPLAVFSRKPHTFTITGGLFQDFAPSAYHFRQVLLPHLEAMGARADLQILQPGYVPQGQGRVQLITQPLGQKSLRSISLLEQGDVHRIRGISLASHLREQMVGQRMAQACRQVLGTEGLEASFELIEDTTAVQKGAALFVADRTNTGCLLGADMAGKIGRRAEQIGRQVAGMLLKDLRSGACVDRHLADQLILFAALAEGTTEYTIPEMTEHVETNLWLVEKMLGATTHREGKRLRIQGIGFKR
jgi:RNA 3'-terminal phosphate cyclase (ATP)